MDAERFDQLVESLTRSGSRRGVLRTLTGAVLGAVGLGTLAEGYAQAQGKKKRRGDGKRKNRKRNTNQVRAQVVPASCCSSGNCTPGAGKNLTKCCYEDANLAGKNFKGANLGQANFSGATLTNANLQSANLGKTCFADTNLTGAKLGGANTGTAIFCRTTMPDGSINNDGCGKDTRCCQTCIEIEGTRCNIGGECCGGAECTGTGDGVCTCPAGETDCDGICADLQTDALNCGTCGNECPAGETCQGGVCRCGSGNSCSTGSTCCSGQCVDLLTDLDNCTECGNVCPRPLANADVACGPGLNDDGSEGYGCTFKCGDNFRNCIGNPEVNGCETRINNDPNNCGGCGNEPGNICPANLPRCCGCRCFEADSTLCSQCQEVTNARIIRRR